MTTRQEISEWFDAGVAQNATHMIVICDTFDMSDYPVYVYPGEDVHEKVRDNVVNMQMLVEVYALHLFKDTQMNEFRAHHYESPPQ
jgi:hypothetical protein